MLFELPAEITAYLAELDDFIEREIKPIEQRDDNIRFFDHRRENARTDWDNDGHPRADWWALLAEMRAVADRAGHYRFAIPAEFGGKDGSNLAMAAIRYHLAAKGLGLHNDLQNESSIVGNLVQVLMLRDFGTEEQKREFIPKMLAGEMGWSFGLTEEHHGSDATHMDTRAVPAVRDGVPGYLINGNKMWTTGLPYTSHVMTFARTNGDDGKARPTRTGLLAECLCHAEHLRERPDAQHARTLEDGIEHRITPREGTGVGGGRFRGGTSAADFEHDDGLAQRDFTRGGQEAARIPHRLHVADDALRVGIVAEPVNQIPPTHIDHGADGDEAAEPHLLAQAPVQHRRAERSALAEEGDAAGARRVLAETRVEARMRHHETEAVRPEQAHAAAPRFFEDLLLQRRTGTP